MLSRRSTHVGLVERCSAIVVTCEENIPVYTEIPISGRGQLMHFTSSPGGKLLRGFILQHFMQEAHDFWKNFLKEGEKPPVVKQKNFSELCVSEVFLKIFVKLEPLPEDPLLGEFVFF